MEEQDILFVKFFKSKEFKRMLGVASISQDHDRKSYDFPDFREIVLRYSVNKKGEPPFFFLIITYEPDFVIAPFGYGIVNHISLNNANDSLPKHMRNFTDNDDELLLRNFVRQVRISSGANEGYVLYSYQPDFGSWEQMSSWLVNFAKSQKQKKRPKL